MAAVEIIGAAEGMKEDKGKLAFLLCMAERTRLNWSPPDHRR